METKMQFQKNAKVLAANGQQLGHIERVVMNPETKVVTHIVARKDAFLKKREDKVVPIDLVAGTAIDHIVLNEEAGDLESLSPFEERHLVDTEGDIGKPSSSVNTGPTIYGFPGGVSIGPASGEKFTTVMEQNIPQGTVALKEGAKVITVEGKHVGNVERVLAEVPADRATHLLVSMGMFTKESKLIPINWVEMMSESEVHLRVRKESLEELADTPAAG